MTTPSYRPPADTTGYVDLRLYDRSDQQIFEVGLAAAQLNMPEWVPREGHTEVLLLESVALEVAEAVVAINRLPGATLETLLRFAGVDRDYGAAPTALAQIFCADTLGHEIPAGTRLYLATADGQGYVTMLVESPGVSIPAGSSTGVVSLIGDVFTSAANGVPAGTSLQMVSPMPFVETITLATPAADGRDPETDEIWRDRGVNRLSRLTEALVLPRHFEAAALEDPNVSRAVVVDNTDPSTEGVGDDPGHVTVAVLGDGGAVLSMQAKDDLQLALDDAALAMLQVHVVDIEVAPVILTVTVHLQPTADPDTTTNAIRQAVDEYLNPLTWTYGAMVRRNEMLSLVDRVPGVDYVETLVMTGQDGAGNLVLATASTVPDLGAITVTLT